MEPHRQERDGERRLAALQGSITVVKHLVPADDVGRFGLKIDGRIEGSAEAVGDQGTTGTIAVPAGTRTVSESGASGTSLGDYTIETVCRDGETVVAGSNGPTVDVQVGRGQAITCVIENTASPKQKTVSPVLECVLFNDGQPDVAYWGYSNTNGHEVSIPIGDRSQRRRLPDVVRRLGRQPRLASVREDGNGVVRLAGVQPDGRAAQGHHPGR